MSRRDIVATIALFLFCISTLVLYIVHSSLKVPKTPWPNANERRTIQSSPPPASADPQPAQASIARPPATGQVRLRRRRGPLYNSEVIFWARSHPEFHLTAGEIKALQDIYSDAYYKRARLEVSLATIEPISASEVFVHIPAYPDQCASITRELTASIIARFDYRGEQLAAAILPLFKENTANDEQRILVTAIPDQTDAFKAVREYRSQSTAPTDTHTVTQIAYVRPGYYDIFAVQPEFLPFTPKELKKP